MSDQSRVLELIQAVGREPAWLADHRGDVLAAVLACDRDGDRELGMRLAAAVWPAAGQVADPRWWTDLAEAGEALAVAEKDAEGLVDLLHGCATTFASHGDRLRAEERWVRALAITRRDGLRDQGRTVLTALGRLYRDWGRLGKALDVYLGLVDLHRAANDPAGTADALAEVGATMHAAGRLTSAAEYLDRADEVLTHDEPPAPDVHARVLVWSGRVRWESGEFGAARRRWSRALAMLVDVDETGADEVRRLLATEPDGVLPYTSSLSGGV